MIIVVLYHIVSNILHYYCFLLDYVDPNLLYFHYLFDTLGNSGKNVYGLCIVHAHRQEIGACSITQELCSHSCSSKLLGTINFFLLLLNDGRRDAPSIGARDPMH